MGYWEEFADGAICAGKYICAIAGIVAGALLGFAWVTVPIAMAVFPILDMVNENVGAVILWVVIFGVHCGLFALGLGLGVRHLPTLTRRALKGIMNESSGTD